MTKTATTELEQAIQKSRKLRPRTRELYLRRVRAFLAFAGTDPKNWTTKTVQAWRDDMQARKVKPQSINVALNALGFAARHRPDRASGRGGRTRFADRVDTLATGNAKEDLPLSYAEGKRLIAARRGRKLRDGRDMAIVVLGLRTGMLRFSMCQIKLQDAPGRRTLPGLGRGRDRDERPRSGFRRVNTFCWTRGETPADVLHFVRLPPKNGKCE